MATILHYYVCRSRPAAGSSVVHGGPVRTLDFNRESPVSSNSGRFYGSSATMTYVLRGRSRGGLFINFTS